MIDSLEQFAPLYLQALGIGSFWLLGLPMLLAPLRWARALRWWIPDEPSLAVYFGRCLGAVICVLAIYALVAASTPAVLPFFFQIVLANVALMILIHAWGAIRRVQPMTETVETFAWLALLLVGLLVYPG
jgi:hypothetical protein